MGVSKCTISSRRGVLIVTSGQGVCGTFDAVSLISMPIIAALWQDFAFQRFRIFTENSCPTLINKFPVQITA